LIRANGGDRWDLIDKAGITELLITRMVLSGRYDGGHHLFFVRPFGALTDVRLPKGIDLRVGGKHYTILPPSVHDASGGAYLWRYADVPAAPLPVEIAKTLEPVKVERTASPIGDKAATQVGSLRPTAGKLAGILNKVATMPEGGDGKCKGRQTIGFWAAGKLLEANYPPAAWDAVEDAMRFSGASEHDIRTALRERPDGRVRA
jgi:Bifunctional DNA primase/polymerase, N-terminal